MGPKGVEMLKTKIMADIKAAVMVIVAENLHALRVLRRNIAGLLSKSIQLRKKR